MQVLSTAPDAAGWRASGVAALAFGLAAVPVAAVGGLLGPPNANAPESALRLRVVLVPFVSPALVEEVLFRGLFLPPSGSPARWTRRLPWWLASLALYVAAHPLVAALARRDALSLFAGWPFLTDALLLGVAATYVRERTRSLWPAVLLHGVVVVAWLHVGGAALLGVR